MPLTFKDIELDDDTDNGVGDDTDNGADDADNGAGGDAAAAGDDGDGDDDSQQLLKVYVVPVLP